VYRNSGHVSHITVKDEGLDTVKGLYLAYGTDQKVGVAIWEEWRYDPNGPQIAQMNTDKEHMFSISVAIRDICGCDTPGGAVTLDGNQVVAQEQTRFLAGLGIRGREGVGEGGLPARFFHADLIGSTMMETGPTGEVESTGGWEDSLLWQYTAFGEPIWPQAAGVRTVQAGRYKYGGTYGYESGFVYLWGANEALPPILLLHVGERWYEPGTGRFIERDPIGLGRGPNLYLYCMARPLAGVDPVGLAAWYDIVIWLTGGDKSPLDSDKFVNRATTCALCVGGAATAGAGVAVLGPPLVGGGGGAAGGALGPAGALLGKGAWLNRGICRFGWSWKAKEGWKLSLRWKNWHWDVW